jgi:hypothetical protein
MKVNSRNIRELHVGKTREERADYNKLLNSDYVFDKTYEEPTDTRKTNSSTVEETKDVVSPKVRGKSLRLTIKDGDFFKNIYVSGILVGLVVVIIFGYISMAAEQGTQKEKIKTIQEQAKQSKALLLTQG